MRFLAGFFAVLLVASCTPLPEPAGSLRVMPVEEPGSAVLPKLVASPAQALRATSGVFSGITFEGVAFDSRSHRLVVLDQTGGPGSRFADAAAAGSSLRGLAALNGGFFTPEGQPLGLVIAEGKKTGAWNSASSLGSGVWHADAAGFSAISRRENLARAGAAAMRELLQAGPMLVEKGRAVAGLDAQKASARTLILWDGGNRWWIGRSSPATLAHTAAALASAPVPGWAVRIALNLDGGRSSDLWISATVPGGPLTRRPPWNRPVRNFLVLVPRP